MMMMIGINIIEVVDHEGSNNHDDDRDDVDDDDNHLHVAMVSGEMNKDVQRERPPSHSEDCYYCYCYHNDD